MGNCKIGQGIFFGLLLVASTSFVPNLPTLTKISQVWAQSNAQQKAQADRLLQQGVQQLKTSQFKAALLSCEQALQIYRQIKDRMGEGEALGNLGIVHHILGDYQKAIAFHQQSLAIAKELGDHLGEGKVLVNLANAYYAIGDYQKALSLYQQRLVFAKQMGDRVGEGKALGNLGSTYYSLGDYQKAIEFHQQSLAILKQMGDLVGEGKTLGNLGNAYNAFGDYRKAIEFYQRALVVLQQTGDRAGVARSLGHLGNVYNTLGDYQRALDFHQKRLVIAQEVGDRDSVATALGGLGDVYHRVGDYTKAINFYQQRLAISQQTGNRPDVGEVLGDLGNAYIFLGEYQKAIDLYQATVKIYQQIGDRGGVGAAFGNLGNAYNYLGDYQKAIDLLQQHIVIAKEIGDRDGLSRSLGNLGLAYSSLGDYPKAIDFHQKALLIAQEIGKPAGVELNNLGLALYKSGNFSEAEKVLKQGIEVWKTQRSKLAGRDDFKISIFEQQARTYRTLQQVLIAQNKIDRSLEVSESGRARAFVDLLASRFEPNIANTTEANIDQIKQIVKSQNTTIVQYSIVYGDFKIAGKERWKESELYIWVIKPTGEVSFRKTDLKPLWQKENTTLNDLVSTSRESIGIRGAAVRGGIDVSYNPDAPKAAGRLKRLHELLINPIVDLLPKNPNDRVTFIPQSSLFLVPFPALQDKNGKYLIEKHTILTSPSIQVLDLTRKQKQRIGNKPIQGNNTLIVGNPTMPSIAPRIGEQPQQLKPLPGAEQEAKAIANLFKTQSLIGNQATETEVVQRLPQARLIHLATHGLFDNIQGLNSSIALAPGNTRNQNSDGLLTAEEILNLKLNAELVVLSACDTGRGRISGDGVIGLSRSLISSGVPSVLVSLWAVPDAPTAGLMTEFYQNLQKNPDKAQALRIAMLATMKQNPNPRDWAAFTLIGEAM